MPPTFLIFLGFIIYIGLTAITFVFFAPLLLSISKRLFAKKVLLTVFISFPCLLTMGLLWTIIFLIPALVFFWLANSNYIPRTPVIVLAGIGALAFSVLVVLTSLYLWFFMSKVIYKRLDKKPVSDYIKTDKVFKFMRPYLIKIKLLNSTY
jgi:hypothetical protein